MDSLRIADLPDDETALVNRLTENLDRFRTRNAVRTKYMDGERAAQALSPLIPPYLRKIGAVLEWPAKAVDALARRTRLDGFDIPGGELSSFGLDVLLDDNEYLLDAPETEQQALIHGVAFEIVNTGGAGQPDAVIHGRSAMDGTGDWNQVGRHLDNFLSIVERGQDGHPRDFQLYLPGELVIVEDRRVVDRQRYDLPLPVSPLPYLPRQDRPMGRSRISRAVMFLTDSAVRAMMRMEGTADFYGTPHVLLLGAALDQMQKVDGSAVSTWDFLMSKINGLPDDDNAENPRADVKQITQASQQPHMDQLDEIAAAFAGTANIPVSSLGVGVKQANPTSAESYLASREDLISDAEDAAMYWGRGHVRSLQIAYMVASGESTLPPELRKLQARWRDPRHTSRAAAADSVVKLVGAFPWLGESDAMLDVVGLPPAIVERLRSDKRRAQARASIGALSLGVTG